MMSVSTDGATKMCCMVDHDYNHMTQTQDYSVGVRSLQENFNNSAAQEIRQALNSGVRHPACSTCWREEDSGRSSKRVRDNQILTKEPNLYQDLAKLELNLGNICNIKCKTCAPSVSSQWLPEAYYQVSLTDQNMYSTVKDFANEYKKYSQSFDDASPFWQDLEQHLPNIREFNFYGGEPFLSRRMWEILSKAVKLGAADKMELHYNTNGTLWPKEVELWQHFKSVNLSFSIDGVGRQFESMRYLARWPQVVKHMKQAQELKAQGGLTNLGWCITISTLNIYYLPEIIDEFIRNYHNNNFGMYLNLVHYAPRWCIAYLPQAVKQRIYNKLNSVDYSNYYWHNEYRAVIDFMMNGQEDLLAWQDFLNQIQLQNQFRNENFAEIFPKYCSIISEYEQQ